MSFLKSAFAFAATCIMPGLLAQQPSTTSLTITSGGTSVSTVKEGTEVKLTATVTAGGAPVVPGQVDFCEVKLAPLRCTDIRLISTVQLASAGTIASVATYNFYPGPGTHNFQAMFLGTHVAAASSSSTLPFVVTPFYPTTTTIAETGGPGAYTLTATVTGTEGTVPPTGNLSFLDTSNTNYTLATAPLIPSPGIPGVSFVNTANPTLGSGGAINEVVSADFNGDGRPDLAVAGNVHMAAAGVGTVGPIQVLLGNGSGAFTPVQSSPFTLLNCAGGATADFNGDGKPDMAVFVELPYSPQEQETSELQILLGNGDGTFIVGQTILSLSLPSPVFITTGDFNGDGIADLVVANSQVLQGVPDNYVTVLLGTGDGTFTVRSVTPTGNAPVSIAVGDFNGDGNADLAVANLADDTISILLGNGDGTFTASPVTPTTGNAPLAIVTADFDGDGALDLAVLNAASNANSVPQMFATTTILRGNGHGTFTPLPPIPATSIGGGDDYAQYLAVGDFNGDGKADLAVSDLLDLWVLLGNGGGTFAPGLSLSLNGPGIPANQQNQVSFGAGVVATDLNGDGLSDIAAVSTVDGVPLFSAFLSNSGPQSATATVSGVSPVGTGTHLVDASYPGDSEYAPSISGTLGLTAEPVPTTLTLTANPTTSNYGQQVALTATITPSTPQQNHIPTGTVTFSNGTTVVGTGTLANGIVIFNTAMLPTGTDSLTATYSGDTNFAPSKASATEVVNSAPSATVLTVVPNPAGLGQPVMLTAAVAGVGISITATGAVTFYDGATLLGSVPLDATGHASFTTSTLALGTHSLTAAYAGNSIYVSGTSAPVSEVIIPSDFTFTLGSTNLSLKTYQHTTIAATLTSIGAFADNITLACVNPPVHVTCIFTPNPAALIANGTTAVSFYIDTDSIVGNGGLAHNDGRRSSPFSLAFLLFPAGLFALLAPRRRRPRANLALLAVLTLPLALALGACGGDIITPVPSAAPGTYVIPVTATGATTGIVHTAQLTLTVTP